MHVTHIILSRCYLRPINIRSFSRLYSTDTFWLDEWAQTPIKSTLNASRQPRPPITPVPSPASRNTSPDVAKGPQTTEKPARGIRPPSRVWDVRIHTSKQRALRELLFKSSAVRYAYAWHGNTTVKQAYLSQIPGDPEAAAGICFWKPEGLNTPSGAALRGAIGKLGGKTWLEEDPPQANSIPGLVLHIPLGWKTDEHDLLPQLQALPGAEEARESYDFRDFKRLLIHSAT